jgi:hypothetical protein
MVTGRQKRDESELKRVKASWSSVETGINEVSFGDLSWFKSSMGFFRAGDWFAALDLPEIPDCMMSMCLSFCRLDSGVCLWSGEAVKR